MILIFQMGLVKSDQQQIVKVAGLFLKLRDDWNLQLSRAGELVAQHGLTCTVIVIFFCHMEPPAILGNPIPSTLRLQWDKRLHDFMQNLAKKSERPNWTLRWCERWDSNHTP